MSKKIDDAWQKSERHSEMQQVANEVSEGEKDTWVDGCIEDLRKQFIKDSELEEDFQNYCDEVYHDHRG